MSKLKGCIYLISNLVNGKRYVGYDSTGEPEKNRWNGHIKAAFDKNSKYPLHRAIRKYGVESFSAEVIWRGPISLLNAKEIYFIKKYRSYMNDLLGDKSYNLTKGGEGFRGVQSKRSRKKMKQSQLRRFENPAERKKLSLAHLGVKLKPQSTAHKAAISEAAVIWQANLSISRRKKLNAILSASHVGLKYGPQSADHRASIGASNRGRKHTLLSRAHMSSAHTSLTYAGKNRKRDSQGRFA